MYRMATTMILVLTPKLLAPWNYIKMGQSMRPNENFLPTNMLYKTNVHLLEIELYLSFKTML